MSSIGGEGIEVGAKFIRSINEEFFVEEEWEIQLTMFILERNEKNMMGIDRLIMV